MNKIIYPAIRPLPPHCSPLIHSDPFPRYSLSFNPLHAPPLLFSGFSTFFSPRSGLSLPPPPPPPSSTSSHRSSLRSSLRSSAVVLSLQLPLSFRPSFLRVSVLSLPAHALCTTASVFTIRQASTVSHIFIPVLPRAHYPRHLPYNAAHFSAILQLRTHNFPARPLALARALVFIFSIRSLSPRVAPSPASRLRSLYILSLSLSHLATLVPLRYLSRLFPGKLRVPLYQLVSFLLPLFRPLSPPRPSPQQTVNTCSTLSTRSTSPATLLSTLLHLRLRANPSPKGTTIRAPLAHLSSPPFVDFFCVSITSPLFSFPFPPTSPQELFSPRLHASARK